MPTPMFNPDVLIQTIWLIPCYPLLGAALSIFWSPAFIRQTGPRPAGYINLLTTLLALVHSGWALSAVWNQPPQYLHLQWLQVADLTLSLPLELSSLTLGASVAIVVLNLLVQVYAIGYMEMDWGWSRLFALLALFEAGMTGLVLCDSLFFSYILLEILTLGTYLIVGYWFNQSLVVTGARDAFLTKRTGDLVLLMGVLALYPLAGTWNFSDLAVWAQSGPEVNAWQMGLIGAALVAGPVSKCAQFPLHLWLDEAMEGPLPTTILRNSVVIAVGAWVMVKMEPVIALSPFAMSLMVAIGTISALGGTSIAVAQIDAKRVMSYLATAYMGLIFIAVGTAQVQAALLLVLTHAVATALLLMGLGSVILGVVTQDITQMGGLWGRRPVTGLSILVGAAGLIALPPLGGFWALLTMMEGLVASQRWGLVGVVLLTNAIAAFAVVRLFGRIFAGESRPGHIRQSTPFTTRAPEPIWLMTLPMVTMAGFTLHLPLILRNLEILPQMNWSVATLLTASSLIGMAVSGFFYIFKGVEDPKQLLNPVANRLLAYDFYTPKIYQLVVISPVEKLSLLADWLDRNVVDGVVNLIGITSLFSGETMKYFNSGKSQSYALTIVFFLALLGFYLSVMFVPKIL